MIENIRKYTGLMIVVLVLLFVGLVFFGSTARSSLTGGSVMEVDNKSITQKEFQRLAVNSQRIPSFFSPMSEGGRTLNRVNYLLGAGDTENNASTSRYLANRYAVRQAGLDYGVKPDLDEVQRYIREILFANPDGSFDQKSYDDFLANQLGRLGMNSRDLNEVLTDLLTADNLLQLLGAGLSPDREMTRALYEDRAQTVSVNQIVFPRAQYSAEIKPTEKEVKAYWEEHKGEYLTAEERKVTYILAAPDWDAALEKARAEESDSEDAPSDDAAAEKPSSADPQPVQEPAASAADSASTPDLIEEEEEITETSEFLPDSAPARSTDTEKPEDAATPEANSGSEEKPESTSASAKDQLDAEQRKQAVITLNGLIDDFWQTVYDEKGAGFEQIATDFKLKPIKTDMFDLAEAPEILQSKIVGERGGSVAERVFRIDPEGSLEERVSDVFRTDEGYFIFRLDGVTPAEELAYEDAKEQATEDLKTGLAIAAMKKDAKAKRTALQKALDDGEKLAGAANKLDLSVSKVNDLTQPPGQYGYNPPAPPSFDLARRLAPGELSELKALPNAENPLSMILVQLVEREITTDEEYQARLDNSYQKYKQQYELMAFENWLNEQYLNNNVKAAR